jgi:DNA (cytosine-5)-methyltransferase 1
MMHELLSAVASLAEIDAGGVPRVPSNNHARAQKKSLTLLAQRELETWSPTEDLTRYENAPFQVVDFFCGCGGMSLGFAALSELYPFFRIVGGCDIDADATRTYERNFKAPAVQIDVRTLDENNDALAAFVDQLDGYNANQPLVAIGCAPCQGFTSHRKKNWDKRDGRNTLVGTFASVAVQLKPACVIMENVPEMLGRRYWNHFEEAKNILESEGYVVRQAIYNAAAFGVPQERFRAIVVAMKHDFLLPEPIIGPEEFKTVRDAIEDLPQVEPGEAAPTDAMHRSARHRKSTIQTIRAVPENGGSRPPGVGPQCLDRIKGFSDVYGRLYWDRPSITITHYARNPASGRFVHPSQHRGLTMREAALLQSFPLGFEFTGSFDSVFKQIGEAVPPKLACGVAANTLMELVAPPPNEAEYEGAVRSVTAPVSSSYSSVIAGLKMVRRSR